MTDTPAAPAATPRFTLDEDKARLWLARGAVAADNRNGARVPGQPGMVIGDCGHPVTPADFDRDKRTCPVCPDAAYWADTPVTNIGWEWRLEDYRDWLNKVAWLIYAAQHAGLFSESGAPAGGPIPLTWEGCDDPDGSTYRWLLAITDKVTVCSPGALNFLEIGDPGTSGPALALSILQEAGQAACDLADDLAALYARGRK